MENINILITTNTTFKSMKVDFFPSISLYAWTFSQLKKVKDKIFSPTVPGQASQNWNNDFTTERETCLLSFHVYKYGVEKTCTRKNPHTVMWGPPELLWPWHGAQITRVRTFPTPPLFWRIDTMAVYWFSVMLLSSWTSTQWPHKFGLQSLRNWTVLKGPSWAGSHFTNSNQTWLWRLYTYNS